MHLMPSSLLNITLDGQLDLAINHVVRSKMTLWLMSLMSSGYDYDVLKIFSLLFAEI